jgi:hypothetical protein
MPFCPKCRYEYRPDIKKCPDCDAKLVDELPVEKEPTIDAVDLVRVASYQFEIEAQEAVLNLSQHGIPAQIANEKIAQTDVILAWADGGVHVVVREDDAARARKVLEED